MIQPLSASVSLSGKCDNPCYHGGVKCPAGSRCPERAAPLNGLGPPLPLLWHPHLAPPPLVPKLPSPAGAELSAGRDLQPKRADRLCRHRGPLVPLGTRGPRCQRPPYPLPTWAHFKGRRGISWPCSQRPARGLFGGARQGAVGAPTAQFPPQFLRLLERAAPHSRPCAPTPSTRGQERRPTLKLDSCASLQRTQAWPAVPYPHPGHPNG